MARILYFGSLPDRLGTAAEDAELPASVTDVRSLLAWLRARGPEWQRSLTEDGPQVTVNKAFANLDTPLSNRDEIAVVSRGLGR